MGQSLDIPRVIPNDWKRLDLIVSKIKFKLGRVANPTFTGLTLSSMTKGSILFAGMGGLISQDNDKLFWDATNFRLGLGTVTPTADFHAVSSSSTQFRLARYSNTSTGANIKMRHARGTVASPSYVLVNEQGGYFEFQAYGRNAADDGDGFVQLVGLRGVVDSVDAEDRLGGRFEWWTCPGASAVWGRKMSLTQDGNLLIGTGTSAKTKLTVDGTLTLKEQAAADGDTAAYGQIWIKNTSPNQAWFVNDLGTEVRIAAQDLQTSASPTFAGATIGSVVIPGVFTAQKEPTGFVDRTATLSWDDGSYTLTITGSHDIYIYGVKTTKSTDSIQIADTTGLHWIYYNASGTLVENTVHPGWDLPIMATVYWNTTGSAGSYNKGLAGEERHGLVMDWHTHEYLHQTVGSRFESGLTGTFDDTTITIETGKWHDEDIEHEPSQQTTCNVLYKNGDANWEWDAGVSVYYKLNGTALRYNNGNNLADCTPNRYMAMWIFATNDISVPIIALMGQRQDTTLANARANNTYESLSFGTLPFKEMKLLYRVILRSTGSPPTYTETQDLRGVSNLPAGTYVATAHSILTGLTTGNDHSQYLLADGTTALAGAWDMGSQALTNVNIDSGVITGITDLAITDGGTGQSSAQAAINALSAVSGATNEHVLTKDTGTGNAVFKAAAGGGAFTSKCSVYRNGAQSIPNSTETKIQFNAEYYDTDNEFDHVTDYDFTVAVTGYYHISVHTRIESAVATTIGRLFIEANGGEIANHWMQSTSYVFPNLMLSKDFYLTAGQVLTFWVWHNGGAAKDLTGTGDYTYMTIHRFT